MSVVGEDVTAGVAPGGSAHEGVVELRWPLVGADAEVFERERPVLLVVAAGCEPPDVDDPLVDWIRLPASAEDVAARCRALVRRATVQRRELHLDRFGRLHRGGQWIVVQSPIDQRLLAHLLPIRGEVVAYERLIDVGWAGESATVNALRVHVVRLNRRIAEVGLSLRGVREVGYVLEMAAST
jgi:hypothetical protein